MNKQNNIFDVFTGKDLQDTITILKRFQETDKVEYVTNTLSKELENRNSSLKNTYGNGICPECGNGLKVVFIKDDDIVSILECKNCRYSKPKEYR